MASERGLSDRQLEDTLREHLPWICGAARRRVRGSPVADDVVQAVLILYWKKRPAFAEEPRLLAWLYQAVRYCAANALRIESNRVRHEREVAMSRPEESGDTQAQWGEVAEELEVAMDGLRGKDRDAILLRFYRSHSLAEVGRLLGVTEEAARKRVDRALDQLRLRLVDRGITAAQASLAPLLIANLKPTVPAKLLSIASAGATSSASAGVIAKHASVMMWTIKAKIAASIALAATILVGVTAVAVIPATMATKPAGQQVASAPAISPAPAAPVPAGDYFVGGEVPQNGIYSLSGRVVTMNQALAGAKLDLAQNQNMIVKLLRRDAAGKSESLFVAAVSQLRGKMDLPLAANDVLNARAPRPADAPIAPGDHLRIRIDDLVAPSMAVDLPKFTDSQGQVHLPLIPAVEIKGLSCDAAGKAIAKAYFDHNVIRNANAVVVRDDILGAWFPIAPIQPGESLLVRIADLQAPGVESRLNLTVSATGDLDLPRIKPVKVRDMEDYEAEEAIALAYRAAGVIQNAQVNVERPIQTIPMEEAPRPSLDPRTRDTFSILGNVPQPGQYSLNAAGQTQPTNIKMALALARCRPESFAPSQVITVIRQHGQLSFHTIGDLLDNPDLDPPLQPRDLLVVRDDSAEKPQPAGEYYITGVARGGVYYSGLRPITIRQALVSAGYRPEDGEFLARINCTGGVSIMAIAEAFRCDTRLLDVATGDVLCVCRDKYAMVPNPAATRPTAR